MAHPSESQSSGPGSPVAEGQDQALQPLESLWQAAVSPGQSLKSAHLSRLRRLVRLRLDQAEELNEEGLQLLDRAIFCTFCDCLDLGAGALARKAVRQLNSASPSLLSGSWGPAV